MLGRLTDEDLNRRVCLYGDKRRGIDLSGNSPIIYYGGWFMNRSTYEKMYNNTTALPSGSFNIMELRDFIGLLRQSGLSLNDVINMEEEFTRYTEPTATNVMEL